MTAPEPRLLLVVGLTGVGKSTVVDALVARRDDLVLLPNRREITDEIIIPDVQRREHMEPASVRDRLERFRLTAAYREVHPGGMTHALRVWLERNSQDRDWQERRWLEPRGERPEPGTHLLFDNLRGLDEVRAAREAFPGARFLVLDASPRTRLARLVRRADPFDRAGDASNGAATAAGALADRLRAIAGFGEVFDADDLAPAALREDLDPDALVTAAQIIVEEQRNYDSAAAIGFLETHLEPERLRIVDTEATRPGEAVERVLAWLAR